MLILCVQPQILATDCLCATSSPHPVRIASLEPSETVLDICARIQSFFRARHSRGGEGRLMRASRARLHGYDLQVNQKMPVRSLHALFTEAQDVELTVIVRI